MRDLNSLKRPYSGTSSTPLCEFLFPNSPLTKSSNISTWVAYWDMNTPTPFLTWLPISSVGTLSDSPRRMRARISSFTRFYMSFHFLPLRKGRPVSSNGFPRTCASSKHFNNCWDDICKGPTRLPCGCSAFSSRMISRNYWESSFSLVLLALCSVRMGCRSECRELRMIWYRLCTCLAVFLV